MQDPVRTGPVTERAAKAVDEEFIQGQMAGDLEVLDDLVASDLLNQACRLAGLQARDGCAQILQTTDHDLGPISFDNTI